jgi:hypothetical protein
MVEIGFIGHPFIDNIDSAQQFGKDLALRQILKILIVSVADKDA